MNHEPQPDVVIQQRVDSLDVLDVLGALHVALEQRDTARGERDAARSTAALLEAELHRVERLARDASATVDRLRLHLQQGVEL